MTKTIVIAAGLAGLLTACADMGTRTLYSAEQPRVRGYFSTFASPPNPTAPNVFIVGDKIVVDQEPVRPPGTQQGDPITIYFGLADKGDYKFPQHGIEIQGHQSFCNPVSDYVFLCTYARPEPGTIYKYMIRVRNDVTHTNLKDLDPQIWN